MDEKQKEKEVFCMKILECSLQGDARFVAEYARVEIYGEEKSIDEHFQQRKRFLNQAGQWEVFQTEQAKGQRPLAFEIGGMILPVRYGMMYYILLWVKFLETHPELVAYLETFDDYQDSTKQGTRLTGADVIRMYFQDDGGKKYDPSQRGRALKQYCRPLTLILKNQCPLSLTETDLNVGFDYLIYTGKIFSKSAEKLSTN